MLTVERHSFFDPAATHTPNRRFTEYWPPRPHVEHQLCNCTKEVCERPEGEPRSISQHFLLSGENGIPWEFSLGTGNLTFKWGEKDAEGNRPYEPHSYFMFGSDYWNSKPRHGASLKVGVVESHTSEDAQEKVFMGTLYLGNEVDTSTLMNGHAPSRIIDLSTVGPNQIWTHECMWGEEAFYLFEDSPEMDLWKDLIDSSRVIHENIELYMQDHTSSVEDLHCRLQGHPVLKVADFTRRLLEPYAKGLESTEFYKVSREIQADCRARLQEKAKAG